MYTLLYYYYALKTFELLLFFFINFNLIYNNHNDLKNRFFIIYLEFLNKEKNHYSTIILIFNQVTFITTVNFCIKL